ncbi:RNA polymerase sigma factor [Streptomyces hydrogenans]|uniref:RNA polymerase sigma factor n=1 Tax=Streptomyces hydrogenans TaxID=1873719 RepID=UPI00365FD3DF
MSEPAPRADELLTVHRDKGQALLRLARRELAAENLPASRTDAEDVVQDAYVRVLINRSKTTIDNPYAYLCTVIRNQVKDLSRRRTAAPFDTTAPTAEAHSVLWVSDLGAEDTDAILDARPALLELTESQRRLVLLQEGWGYTQSQIAELTGVRRGTVATHIRRAKSKLTAALTAVILTGIALAAVGHRELAELLRWILIGSHSHPDHDTTDGPTRLIALIPAATALGRHALRAGLNPYLCLPPESSLRDTLRALRQRNPRR